MWKFLRYWTGINLVVSMPFIAPLAAALHGVFNRRDCSCPPPQRRPKNEQPVRVTRTEAPPPPSITWKRVYRGIAGQAPETKPKAAPERVPARGEQHGSERAATLTFPAPSRAPTPEQDPKRSRRRGMRR